jgi:glycerophosphoryl diester phosphodiesterase
VFGHRGARKKAPENTMAAFERAVADGADGVELDVRLDGDGEVVVIHDTTLSRVTGGRDDRHVDVLGKSELGKVDVGQGERVPLLAEVLSWARERRTRVNVELKADLSRRAALVWKVVRMVGAEPDAGERLILSSFDPRLLFAVARILPWVPAGYLIEKAPVPRPRRAELLLGASAVHPNASLVTATSIAPWQEAQLPVNVWTVNDPGEARRLDQLGVDCIITDEPGEILKALDTDENLPR